MGYFRRALLALLSPWHLIVFWFHLSIAAIETLLVLVVKALRVLLRPGRYVFFALGQFKLTSLIKRDGWRVRLSLSHVIEDAHVRRNLEEARSYKEYDAAATALEGIEPAPNVQQLRRFWNRDLVKSKMGHMQKMKDTGDDVGLLSSLRLALDRNFGGVSHPSLYRFSGSPIYPEVEEYTVQVEAHLHHLLGENSPLNPRERDRLLREAQQSVGRTALCLSGGGMLALHHCGVIKALHEQQLLPDIVSGSSGGSIVAAILGVTPDEKLLPLLNDEFPAKLEKHAFIDRSRWDLFKRLIREGVTSDSAQFENTLAQFLGDTTFHEAYQMTGRIINVCVSPRDLNCPILLNYINAPDVLLRSAVAGSCALHYVLHPCKLKAKDASGKITMWANKEFDLVDGSLEGDLPLDRLKELYHCTHFIVSQVNPHVTPFLMSPQEKRRESKLLRVQKWLQLDVLNQLRQIAQLAFFPSSWGRHANKLMKQQYLGRLHDVSIWPVFKSGDPMRMISNPTVAQFHQLLLQGERTTWPKIKRLRNQMRVELCLLDMQAQDGVAQFRGDNKGGRTSPVSPDHMLGKAKMRRNISDPALSKRAP